MPRHIHTGVGEYDHTSSVYLVRADLEDAPVMTFLTGHSVFERKRMQIGGHEELIENPWQAALRELEEEAGYAADQEGLFVLQPNYYICDEGEGDLILPVNLQPVVHDFNGDSTHRHTDTAYALIACEPPVAEKAQGERVSQVFESLRQIEALGDDEIIRSVRRLAVFTMTIVLEQWERVPLSNFRVK